MMILRQIVKVNQMEDHNVMAIHVVLCDTAVFNPSAFEKS